MNKILKDIRFWIVFLFLLRLYGITNPPLEVGHNWRQTIVAMAARNFFETDANVLYPRVDFAGEKTGITGMEFPILNYLIFLLSKIFGYQHWYGRLINLIVSSFGLWFFYKLIAKYFGERISFFSTMILSVSIWFQFSRKIMPDTFSMSFIIAGIYYAANYLDYTLNKSERKNLFLSFLFILIGTLSKISSAYLLIIIVLLFIESKLKLRKKLLFLLVSSVTFVPIAIWYFYWVPHLVATFEFWHFFMGNNSIWEGVLEIANHLPETLSRFYDTALKYIGFLLFLTGLVFALKEKNKKIILVLGITLIAFCIIIFKAGYVFSRHNYYIIPFVPIMALVAGYGLASIKNAKASFFLLTIIIIEGVANQQHDFRIKKDYDFLTQIENDLDRVSNRNELILINSDQCPTPMYFTHRKGWIASNEEIIKSDYITKQKDKGLKYILILKKCFGTDLNIPFGDKLIDNQNYCFYELH